MTYEESHFQAAKKLKRLSQEAMYPWAKGLMNPEEMHFQSTKFWINAYR
jgi:hypothetical protein